MAESTPSAAANPFSKPGFAVSLLGAALPGLYLLITSTTTLVTSIWPYDFKRMLEFGLLFVLFLLPAASRTIRDEFGALLGGVPRWVTITLFGVFGWGVLSAVVNARSGMHAANCLSEVALLASLVLGVFVVGACRRVSQRSFDQVAVGLLALMGLAVGVQEVLGVFAAHAGGVEFNFRISLLHFSWPRFYNQVQSWTVPAIAALPVLFTRSSLAKVLCVIVLGLHWYVILMTGARGSFLALTVAMLFAVVFLPSVRGLLLKWQLAGAVLGAVLYAGVLFSFQVSGQEEMRPPVDQMSEESSQRRSGFYGNEDESTGGFVAQSVGRPLLDPMGRIGMWRHTLRDARANPILGIGPMNYVCTSPAYIGHPHNFPLQLAAEWGLPVALAVCVLGVLLVMQATLKVRGIGPAGENDATMPALWLTGTLAAGLHACVSGVMVMPASQTAGLLTAGALVGALASIEYGAQAARTEKYLRFAALLVVTGLIVLGIHELRTMTERSEHLRPGEDMRPRIWQDAKVCRIHLQQIEVTN